MSTQVTKRFYPALSSVVNEDEIPDVLGFLKEGIVFLFDKIYFKDLQYSKSPRGDAAFYSLSIVTKDRIDIEIPGTGIYLILNPDLEGGDVNISSFPITIEYEWKLLAYLRSFDLDQFDFSPKAFFETALRVLSISEEQAIANFINTFTEPIDANTSSLEQFVTDLNDFNSAANLLTPTQETTLTDVVKDIYAKTDDYATIMAFGAYILNNDFEETKVKLKAFFKSLLPQDIEEYIKDILIPKFRTTLLLRAAIEFPRNMLQPVFPEGHPNQYNSIPQENEDGYPRAGFSFAEALFYASTEEGFGYEMDIALTSTSPAMIGNTGIILNIQRLKVDLSDTENIPEADLEGRPSSFKGVYADEVSIILPPKWFNNVDNSTLQIAGRNLLIGTGGVSGTIALETIDGVPNNGVAQMAVNIGSWELGFNYFNLIFSQNVIVESSIIGSLKIPKLKDANDNDAEITISGHINEEGDFNLTASEPDGIPFTFFDFMTINFLTLELGREDDNFYIGTSCQIWFENDIMSELLKGQKIEIPQLRVYDNGRIEIVGGNSFIPTNIAIDLGPAEIAVTNIHFGSTQLEYEGNMRQYNYWGFDGAMSLDPIGVDARGQGIKYYYTIDNDEFGGSGDSFLQIQSIEINLIIPGSADPSSAVAIIRGMLTLPEPGQPKEYVGEVSLKLPKAKIAGGAAMKLQPRYPAFIIDAFIDLPAPIPIGPLGIYGFRGLLGFRYVAEKETVGLVSGEDTWYDYYTHPPKGVHVSKFSGPEQTEEYESPFSLGAGAVLGTGFDSGTVISMRVMLLLSLPTLFLIEGRASILSERLGLDDEGEPPFFAFLAWGDDSIEAGMGADFKVPGDSGWILDLYAEVQSGFFFDNPSTWYVNFGTREVPISARVLTIITAQSYLMLSAQGIEAGARASFEIEKRFGPAKVYLYAYIEVGGYISFERPQIGGYIAAGGGIDIDIWIISFSISLDAIISAEAAKPFLLYAEVEVRGCARILFAKVCKNFTIKLKWEKSTEVDRSPITPLPYSQTGVDRTNELVKGIHMLTNEAFDLDYLGVNSGVPSVTQISKIIPLDTYIEFKVEKGLIPTNISSKIGGYTFPPEKHIDLVPPQKIILGGAEIRQVKHKYSIEEIEIKAWNGDQWIDYHPFKAVVDQNTRPEVENLKIGYWQIKEKQYDTIRLMATTPFTYMEAGEPGWSIPEVYGITPSTLFCAEEIRELDCSNVLNKILGQQYFPPTQYIGHFINGAYFTLLNLSGYEIIDGNLQVVENDYMQITNTENVHEFEKSLSFSNYNHLVIILPEASVQVKLFLTTDASGVTIKYYKSAINELTSVVEYELVHYVDKTADELHSVVLYANDNVPITKIIIEPVSVDEFKINTLISVKEQIAKLFETSYNDSRGEIGKIEPSDIKLYDSLVKQLEGLTARSCSKNGRDDLKKEGDCKPNPIICEFYNQLLELFNICFVPVQTSEEVDENINCFLQFQSLVEDVNEIIVSSQLIAELNNYINELERIQNLVGHHEQIIRFNNLKIFAQTLLDIILALGDCDCVVEFEKCATSLQQVCWLTLENHEWNETIPGSDAIEAEHQDMLQGIQNTIQPIWRPNTSYYVRYKLKDEVDNGESTPGLYDYYYGFKTVGPLGHFHKDNEVDYIPQNAGADQYPLTSLRSYIDYNTSYPNADGDLLKAKPAFYSNGECKITIRFIKPSTYHMFNKWNEYDGLSQIDGELHIAIKDPVTDVVIPYPLPIDFENETVPLPDGTDTWVDDDPRIPPHIQVLINMIENGEIPCDIELGELVAPLSSAYSVTLTNLKPRKLYTALLYNAFEVSDDTTVSEPVHEFVFQTSRYPNFTAQVKSYQLSENKQAVYQIDLALSNTDVNKAYDIINNPEGQIGDPLENEYQHLFDRVVEGVFGMLPPDPPETTEFNKIYNINTGEIVALLIRNPEPFNIPKIPLSEIQETIKVIFDSGSTNNSYKVLHSKDYSQALIMHSSKNITAETLNFQFTYLIIDGSEYVEEGINAEGIIINN